jgi:excisionase family DNA binding protein
MAATGKPVTDHPSPPVLTADELSTYLRIHRSTVYRMIRHREIPFFRMGTDYRFSREAIDEWRKAQEAQSALPSPPSRRGKPRNV